MVSELLAYAILAAVKRGETQAQIAHDLRVSSGTIRNVLKRPDSYTHQKLRDPDLDISTQGDLHRIQKRKCKRCRYCRTLNLTDPCLRCMTERSKRRAT